VKTASPDAPAPTIDVDTEEELYSRMAKAGDHEDLGPLVNAVFRVRCGDARPVNALISAHDGRRWYWIDNNDRTSRILFAMVRDMYNLQVTADGQGSPVLTPPVGAGR
jgi:hypothetical protein